MITFIIIIACREMQKKKTCTGNKSFIAYEESKSVSFSYSVCNACTIVFYYCLLAFHKSKMTANLKYVVKQKLQEQVIFKRFIIT